MAQNVYSPKDVDIAIAGANIDGWDSITISRNTENTSKNISADGTLGLTYSADVTGSFELEVQQQNSPVNAFFSAIQLGQDDQRKPLFFDLAITDKSGGAFANLKGVFLDMPANQDLATEAGSRTWMFYVSNLNYVPSPPGFEGVATIASAVAAYNTLNNNLTNID